MTPDLAAVLEETWPAAALHRAGPWLVRVGAGGGKRVSAASAEAPEAMKSLRQMEEAQAALGQPPLVVLREGETALDRVLEEAGYRLVDPVVAYSAPVDRIAGTLPALAAFVHWPALAVQRDIWARGGIGAGRLAVMDRAAGPKATILARAGDRPAGTGFVAIHGGIAMVHALEVAQDQRRKGVARAMLRAAANWAAAEGAARLSLVVTEANAAARALYASLGMEVVGSYHYRMKQA